METRSTEERHPAAERARRWWEQPTTWNVASIVLGVGTLIVGVIVAIHAEEPTMVLIVGGALVLLPVLLHQVSELTARYKGWEFTAKMAEVGAAEVEVQAEHLDQLAAGTEDPQLKLELSRVIEELERVSSQLTEVGKAPQRPADPLVEMLSSRPTRTEGATPSHANLGNGKVQLTLTYGGRTSLPPLLACKVIPPTGRAVSTDPAMGTPWDTVEGVIKCSYTYPDDFLYTAPLEEGNYLVEWRAVPFTASGLRRHGMPLLAVDQFYVDGEPPAVVS